MKKSIEIAVNDSHKHIVSIEPVAIMKGVSALRVHTQFNGAKKPQELQLKLNVLLSDEDVAELGEMLSSYAGVVA